MRFPDGRRPYAALCGIRTELPPGIRIPLYFSSEIGLDKTVAKYFVLRIIHPVKNNFQGELTVKIEIFLIVT